MSNDFEGYLSYLKGRSRLGQFYRNYWLYPNLNRFLKGTLLDVGCGIGDMLRYRKDSIGVDINPAIVDFCRSQGLNVYLLNDELIPFDAHEFDSVILDNVLEHIENPDLILSETYRVLSNDGVLVVGVPGIKGFKADSDHKVFYDKEFMCSTLNAAGFKTKKIIYMPFAMKSLGKYLSSFCMYGIFEKS